MSTVTTPALSDLPRAIEDRDAGTQSALYTEDAVLTTIDADHGPSNPVVARGRTAIAASLAEVCARDMTHEVTFFLHDGDAGVGRRRVPLPRRHARAVHRDAAPARRADRRADDRPGLGPVGTASPRRRSPRGPRRCPR